MSSDFYLCLLSESPRVFFSGNKTFLFQESCTWRHVSLLLSTASLLQSANNAVIHFKLPSFLNLCTLTGDSLRRGLLLSDDLQYILELMVGFQTNLGNELRRKQQKYRGWCGSVVRVISSSNRNQHDLGICKSIADFLDILGDLHFDKRNMEYIHSWKEYGKMQRP